MPLIQDMIKSLPFDTGNFLTSEPPKCFFVRQFLKECLMFVNDMVLSIEL